MSESVTIEQPIDTAETLEQVTANGAGEATLDTPPEDPAALIAQLEVDLAEERAKASDLLDKNQRMAAEFQNSRRRQERQLAEEIERASVHLIKRILPVVDDFDLAFANVPAEIDAESPWVEGFRQIQKKLHGLLEDEGVTRVRSEGEFDPVLHEAIVSMPSEDVPSGNILDAMRAGYEYKGRVLRPALVRVAQ
jgi:molecular chaperone GrpE